MYYLKNKYILTFILFSFYALFLDEIDVFVFISQKIKLTQLNEEKVVIEKKLRETKNTLIKLHYNSELETYARENKLFKRENEDIFIITNNQ